MGGIGLAMIGTGHVYLYAIAASGGADAGRITAARDSAVGPVGLLFLAAPVAVVLMCAAAVRSRLAPWPLLVIAAAFLVLEFVPTPAGELPALVAGLVGFGWIGFAMVAGRPDEVGSTPTAARRTATVA